MRYLLNLVVFLIITSYSVQAEKLIILWEKEYEQSENYSYVAHEGSYIDGMLNIIGYAFESQTHSTGKYWFWRLDAAGKLILQNDLYTVSNGRSSTIGFGSWLTKGLKIDQDDIYCSGKFGSEIGRAHV